MFYIFQCTSLVLLSFVKFIPKHSGLSGGVIRGIFFNFFLNCSWMVYRNMIELDILILYPVTLPSLFISSNNSKLVIVLWIAEAFLCIGSGHL